MGKDHRYSASAFEDNIDECVLRSRFWQVDSAEWNAAAIGSGEVNPFVLHGFLQSLESSSSAASTSAQLSQRPPGTSYTTLLMPVYDYSDDCLDTQWP